LILDVIKDTLIQLECHGCEEKDTIQEKVKMDFSIPQHESAACLEYSVR
jgi:hypothetical protein